MKNTWDNFFYRNKEWFMLLILILIVVLIAFLPKEKSISTIKATTWQELKILSKTKLFFKEIEEFAKHEKKILEESLKSEKRFQEIFPECSKESNLWKCMLESLKKQKQNKETHYL
ncbi:MAG: hypothetical protein ACI86H_001436 [bacterium]|jgi:hypothetical protein